MSARPRTSTRDAYSLEPASEPEPLLPTHSTPLATSPTRRSPFSLSSLRHTLSLRALRSRNPFLRLFLLVLLLIGLLNHTVLGTWRRDAVYLLRPIWDTPPRPFTVIPHYAPPLLASGAEDIDQWCALHTWTPRKATPTIVDAILLSSEVDLLEIRMREYRGVVDIFVIVESDMTFAGTPKPLYYEENKRRFEHLVAGTKSRIVYKKVEGLVPNRPAGSFENEYTMRTAVGDTLSGLRLSPGAVIINSDVDEIISRQTLHLLSTCNVPDNLHLNVKNYRYSFNLPIPDDGYWRPHISVVKGGPNPIVYTHGRVGDVLLEGAGWHCTFCFRTFGEMRGKMLGYSHNDRVRDTSIAEIQSIKARVCEGREPFDMYPVSRGSFLLHTPPTSFAASCRVLTARCIVRDAGILRASAGAG